MTTENKATINGDVLRLQREAKGWTLGDLASRACLSIKQVRQLEEGGNSSFYSESVKVNTAKKVAGLLDVSLDELFNVPESVLEAEAEVHAQAQLSDGIEIEIASASSPALETSDDDEAKSKTPIWSIAALFVVAVGVAAVLRPSTDTVTTEPAPVVQAAPDAEVPASAQDAASGAQEAASATEKPAAPASASVAPMQAPTPATTPAPKAAASAVANAASSHVAPAPANASAAAPAASKP
jgi:transcriptional regulator with XRE-family HTH domain